MSFRRSLSWSAALRDLRADRAQVSPEARRAHNRREAFSTSAYQSIVRDRTKAPLVVAGRYDRAAIMAAAVRIARANQTVTGDAWSVCMSAALKGAWRAAKDARRYASH